MIRPFRLLIYIVAYNASAHLAGVLSRIPPMLWSTPGLATDVLISDDASQDDTFGLAERYAATAQHPPMVQRNARNLGYGGNQKLGYRYAIDHGYDAVLLLHGDGQYDPALIPQLIAPVMHGRADVVIGSRMVNKKAALKGGMPLYKFIGNIVLTTVQNRLLGVRLAEFHSGYRVYSTRALRAVPFEHNADYFDFDTDILIQCFDTHQRIEEIAIPTFYGDEICHVNGLRYAWLIMLSTVLSRLQRYKLFYCKRFDYSLADSPHQRSA